MLDIKQNFFVHDGHRTVALDGADRMAGWQMRPFIGSGSLVSERPNSGVETYVRGAAFGALADFRGPLILAAAPAGYGKSALLDAFCFELNGGRDIWRCSARESDLLDIPSRPSIVVVDDADDADPDMLRDLAAATLKQGGRRRLLVAMRRLPDLDLVGLQLSNQALVLRASDLRLTELQTAELFRRLSKKRLSPALRSDLYRLTEGWPVAVGLSAQAASHLPVEHIATVTNLIPHDQLRAYFRAQIGQHLDKKSGALLRQIAYLDHVSPELIREVVSGPSGPGALDSLQPVLTPSALRESWFNVPAALAHYLREQAPCSEDDRKFLHAASEWSERQGFVEDAVECLLRAGDLEAGRDLLQAKLTGVVRRSGNFPRLSDWISQFEHAGIFVSDRIKLWSVWSAITRGLLVEGRVALDHLRQSRSLSPKDSAFAARLNLELTLRTYAPTLAIEEGEKWLEAWSEATPLHVACVNLILSLAHLANGNEPAARRCLAIARETGFRVNGALTQCWIVAAESYQALLAGNAEEAALLIDEASALAMGAGGASGWLAGEMRLLNALIRLELGDLTLSSDCLATSREARCGHSMLETRVLGQLAEAALAEAKGGLTAALQELRQPCLSSPRAWAAVRAERVHMLLRHGRVAEARAEFNLYTPTDGATGGVERASLEAWLVLAEGDATSALSSAQLLVAQAEVHGRGRRLVDALLLRAAAERVSRDLATAERTLRRAIHVAAAGGLIQTVARARWALGESFAQLNFEPLTDRAQLKPFIGKLRERLGLRRLVRDRGADAVVEILTGREREVLRLLESDSSAADLARQMSVSAATARWHIRNVYTKLGVKSRAGALRIGRDLELL